MFFLKRIFHFVSVPRANQLREAELLVMSVTVTGEGMTFDSNVVK